MPDVILPNELPRTFPTGQADEALNPHYFPAEAGGVENPALKRAHTVANTSYTKANALIELRDNRVDDLVVHCRKVKDSVDRWSRDWANEWEGVKGDLKRERTRVEDSLKAKANLKANPDYRSAIVGVFSGLKPDEKMAEIDRALSEGDGPTLAVLLEAPPLVTGLTKEQREAIKVRAYTNADAGSYAVLKQLEKSIFRAERASLAAIDTMQKLLAGTDRFDRKIERAKAAEATVMN